MSFSMMHIWVTMGPLAKIVAGFLVLMALASVAVVFERVIVFMRSKRDSRRFAASIAPLLDEWKLAQVLEKARPEKHSDLAKVFAPIIERYLKARTEARGKLLPSELARNEAERQKERSDNDLRRGLGVLASVGSVAPARYRSWYHRSLSGDLDLWLGWLGSCVRWHRRGIDRDRPRSSGRDPSRVALQLALDSGQRDSIRAQHRGRRTLG